MPYNLLINSSLSNILKCYFDLSELRKAEISEVENLGQECKALAAPTTVHRPRTTACALHALKEVDISKEEKPGTKVQICYFNTGER